MLSSNKQGSDPSSILDTPGCVKIQVDAPASIADYTRAIETICRQLDKEKAGRVTLCIAGGPVVAPLCSPKELQQWELALAKLQKRSLLLIAVLDGPLCDLSLSLALACDFRLASPETTLPSRRGATGGGTPYVPLPIWWLASLALHTGILRARQLLWRSRTTPASELLTCGVVHSLGSAGGDLFEMGVNLPVPSNAPLALLRRIVLQGFSISGNDLIGHSLAVNSLVIVDAVGRAASAYAPLPPLVPLGFQLEQSADVWVLSMTAEVRGRRPPPARSPRLGRPGRSRTHSRPVSPLGAHAASPRHAPAAPPRAPLPTSCEPAPPPPHPPTLAPAPPPPPTAPPAPGVARRWSASRSTSWSSACRR